MKLDKKGGALLFYVQNISSMYKSFTLVNSVLLWLNNEETSNKQEEVKTDPEK